MVTGPRRGEPALPAAGAQLRPPAAARARLLRARAVGPDHDADDHGRRRAVVVPADRAGPGGGQPAHGRRGRRSRCWSPTRSWRWSRSPRCRCWSAATLWFRVLSSRGVRRGPRAGRGRQRRHAGERHRRAGRAGVHPRAAQRRGVRRPQPRLPPVPAARAALHRDVLPVRRAAQRPRDGRGARRRRRPGRVGRADPRRAHRVPALPRPVLRPGPAALPGLRRLPAGPDRAAPHRRPAAHPDHRARRGHAATCRGGCAARWSCATSASPTPARTGPRSTACRCGSRPGRRSRWSARRARASRRWSSCSPGSTTRAAAPCSSTAWTCARYRLAAFRHRLGIVPQEPHLFTGDVAANIAYGRPDATPAEIEAAARAVGALDLVRRPAGGFRTPVGERGQGLSAGQRQLVALARAELVGPDLLLFDEATAALDPATEAAVLAAGRPGGVAAHRVRRRAPAGDGGAGRPGGRAARRPDRRAGSACRTARGGRAVHPVVAGRRAGTAPRTSGERRGRSRSE